MVEVFPERGRVSCTDPEMWLVIMLRVGSPGVGRRGRCRRSSVVGVHRCGRETARSESTGTARGSLWSDGAMTTTRSPKTSRWMHALGWFGRRPGRRWRARTAQAVILAGLAATRTLGSNAAAAQATGVPGLPVKALAKSCDLRFMPIKPTVTGPSILGNAYAICDVPAERHALTLSLQYLPGGTWKTGLPMNLPTQNRGWPLKPIQGVVLALLRRSGRCGHAGQPPRRPADPPRASSLRSRER
jgi:hypothetical protein